MSSFCTAKATHIFSAKNFSIFAYHISLTNDIVSVEQLGPGPSVYYQHNYCWLNHISRFLQEFPVYQFYYIVCTNFRVSKISIPQHWFCPRLLDLSQVLPATHKRIILDPIYTGLVSTVQVLYLLEIMLSWLSFHNFVWWSLNAHISIISPNIWDMFSNSNSSIYYL